MTYNDINIETIDYSEISIQALIKHLNLDDDLVDEPHLNSLIEAAVDWCEGRINRFIVPVTCSLEIFDFTGNKITISKGGINEITSIEFNGEPITDYRTIRHYNSTSITLKTPQQVKGDIKLEFTGGRQTKANYKQAVLIKAGDLYDTNRSDYSAGLSDNNIVMKLLNLM